MQAQNKDVDSATKCFDDRVFARALMIVCHLWLPNYVPAKPELVYGRPSLRTKDKIIGRTRF